MDVTLRSKYCSTSRSWTVCDLSGAIQLIWWSCRTARTTNGATAHRVRMDEIVNRKRVCACAGKRP